MVNVDLLIKNEQAHTLLTWRDDGYCAPGWHVPGGILRFKETICSRIHAVADSELGARVRFDAVPLAVSEIRHPSRQVRGHFVSLLYRCTLESPPDPRLRHRQGHPIPGQWAWHDSSPADLIDVHAIYRPFF
jgi:colanic acid biosynthesis protein WcaH